MLTHLYFIDCLHFYRFPCWYEDNNFCWLHIILLTLKQEESNITKTWMKDSLPRNGFTNFPDNHSSCQVHQNWEHHVISHSVSSYWSDISSWRLSILVQSSDSPLDLICILWVQHRRSFVLQAELSFYLQWLSSWPFSLARDVFSRHSWTRNYIYHINKGIDILCKESSVASLSRLFNWYSWPLTPW